MRYDVPLFYFLVAVGLFCRKLDWRGWFGISVLLIGWILYNWLRV
jgi:drug/metabolite transporter (DMT)-like permease